MIQAHKEAAVGVENFRSTESSCDPKATMPPRSLSFTLAVVFIEGATRHQGGTRNSIGALTSIQIIGDPLDIEVRREIPWQYMGPSWTYVQERMSLLRELFPTDSVDGPVRVAAVWHPGLMVDPGVVHQDCQVTPPHKRTPRQIQVSTTNALEKLDLDDILSSKRVIVLLDYDGTLSPIVQDPSKAVLPSHVRDTLIELSKLLTVGIVSGRGLEKLKSFVNIPDLMYAGSHGFDIWIPDAEEQHYQVASDYLPKLAALREQLTDKLSSFRGARVEDNIFSVTVHYRECTDVEVPKVREVVEAAKADYPDIRFSTGKKVFELKPNIVWNKGCAMLYILRSLGLLQRDDTYIIYVGDDVTDEDAFQVFHEDPCPQGVGIVVSDEDKDTGATYSLRSPDEVATFLTRLIEVQRRIGGPADA